MWAQECDAAALPSVAPRQIGFDTFIAPKGRVSNQHKSAGFGEAGRRPLPRAAGGCATTYNL